MRVLDVKPDVRLAEVECGPGEVPVLVSERLREALLLIANEVRTQEVGGKVAVTWQPWPDRKRKTDMTPLEVLTFAATSSAKDREVFGHEIQAKILERAVGAGTIITLGRG